jgi:hypothetical protein
MNLNIHARLQCGGFTMPFLSAAKFSTRVFFIACDNLLLQLYSPIFLMIELVHCSPFTMFEP